MNEASTSPPQPAGLDPAAGAAGATGPRRWPVRFSGSGSEYFRIWIVNLLLTLVTLTLYYPWAKVRKLRYFYGNTEVAGHALDFHGEPSRMMRGYLLVGALFLVYSVAGRFSAVAGVVALVAVAVLWPLLFRASMRFRLAQTSWRGLRLQFAGDTAGAYKALLPAYLPAVFVLAVVSYLAADQNGAAGQVAADAAGSASAPLLAMLGAMLCVPLIWWALKRYQHGHYRLAGVQTRFTASVPSFYGLFLKALLVSVAAGAAVAVLAGLISGAGLLALLGGGGRSTGAVVVAAVIGMLALYAALLLVVYPYFVSRLQNLVWSRTESPAVGFDSNLRWRPLLGLTLKNWLLVLLTLGLYWPFAAVALAKLKLEAVTVVAHEDLDTLVAGRREAMKDASGEAAADLFDIDLGL